MSDGALYFETVEVGDDLATLTKGPMTTAHLMRWSAAIENWHRIHYDEPFAVGHDRLPGLLIAGSWKQHVLVQLLKNWVGATGHVWKIAFTYRGMDVAGDTIVAFGRVDAKEMQSRCGLVRCTVGLRNQRGEVNTEGRATVLLRLQAGPPLPYPIPYAFVEERQ